MERGAVKCWIRKSNNFSVSATVLIIQPQGFDVVFVFAVVCGAVPQGTTGFLLTACRIFDSE
jgi:hypothetical protein